MEIHDLVDFCSERHLWIVTCTCIYIYWVYTVYTLSTYHSSFQLGGVDTTSGHQLLCKIIPWIQNEIGTSEFDHIQFPSHCSDFKIFFSFQDNWMLFITTFHSFQLMDSCSCSFVLDNWMLFITTLQSFQLMEAGRPRMNPGCQRSPCCKKSEHFLTLFNPS